LSARPANNFGIRLEWAMSRHRWFSCFVFIVGVVLAVGRAHAVLLLYEPFNYPESYFLSATSVGAANTATSPIGYMAPNFNNWYGTAIGREQAARLGEHRAAREHVRLERAAVIAGQPEQARRAREERVARLRLEQ
jgi:hypothetical protein